MLYKKSKNIKRNYTYLSTPLITPKGSEHLIKNEKKGQRILIRLAKK